MNVLPVIGVFIISMLPGGARHTAMLEPMAQVDSSLLLDILVHSPENTTMVVKDISEWPDYARVDSFFANYLLDNHCVDDPEDLSGYFRSVDGELRDYLIFLRYLKRSERK